MAKPPWGWLGERRAESGSAGCGTVSLEARPIGGEVAAQITLEEADAKV